MPLAPLAVLHLISEPHSEEDIEFHKAVSPLTGMCLNGKIFYLNSAQELHFPIIARKPHK